MKTTLVEYILYWFLDTAASLIRNTLSCTNFSLSSGHAYYHSTKFSDQISYFHGKRSKGDDSHCLWRSTIDTGNFELEDPRCKKIDYGFQTMYNLRTRRFSQRKHYFPKNAKWNEFLMTTNFQIVQIGDLLWFVGGTTPQSNPFGQLGTNCLLCIKS